LCEETTEEMSEENNKKETKTVKKREKLPQENNNLFVYFFHSVEVCCTRRFDLTAERLKKFVLTLSSESFPQHFQHNKLFLNLQSISVISSFFECLLRVVKCSVCSDPFSIPSRFHKLCILLTEFNFLKFFSFSCCWQLLFSQRSLSLREGLQFYGLLS
jgi:hypothetical protein